jgi:hypothetical protein
MAVMCTKGTANHRSCDVLRYSFHRALPRQERLRFHLHAISSPPQPPPRPNVQATVHPKSTTRWPATGPFLTIRLLSVKAFVLPQLCHGGQGGFGAVAEGTGGDAVIPGGVSGVVWRGGLEREKSGAFEGAGARPLVEGKSGPVQGDAARGEKVSREMTPTEKYETQRATEARMFVSPVVAWTESTNGFSSGEVLDFIVAQVPGAAWRRFGSA